MELNYQGNKELLKLHKTAFLCSRRVPATVVLKCYDWAIERREQGSLPREAREMASFLALIVDTSTKINLSRFTPTDIRCFEKGCQGTTRVEILPSKEIHWMCSRCENEGRISHWQGTKWDNMKKGL